MMRLAREAGTRIMNALHTEMKGLECTNKTLQVCGFVWTLDLGDLFDLSKSNICQLLSWENYSVR